MAIKEIDAQPLETGAQLPDQASGPFFRRVDRTAFWIGFLITLLAYFHTMAPTVTLEDSGELAVGSDYLGVPHPPGYPIWTLFTWLFQWLFHWVKYFGTPDSNWMLVWKSIKHLLGQSQGVAHPNPGWGVALCSAFSGALACGMQAMLVCRSGFDMLRGLKRATEVLGERQENFICLVGGVTSGLLLAFSPVLWSQSTIVEVYALNAAFQIGCLLLLYRWMSRPDEHGALMLMWYVFGIGLTNHQTLIFLGPALAVGILVRGLPFFSTFAVAGAGLVGVVVCNSIAKKANATDLLWSGGPAHMAFWFWTALIIALPVASWLLGRKGGRTATFSVWLALIGLAFNGFMSFASEQNPPINWGYPRTWEGFMHAITRGQYEAINMADIFGERFLLQVGMYLKDLRGQFTLPIVVLGALPFCAWSFGIARRRIKVIYPASALAVATAVLALIDTAAEIRGIHLGAIGNAYRVLGMLVVPLAAIGLMIKVVEFYRSLWNEITEGDWLESFIGYAILVLTGLGVLVADIQWIRHLFTENMQAMSKILITGLIIGPPAVVMLILSLRNSELALRFEIEARMQRVLLMTVVAFLSLSVIFITFQNLDLDIQTLFIGRVQFIQSHAIFSLWLGFGLIFLLANLDLMHGGRKVLTYSTAVLAALIPLALVYQNYYDEEQISIVGSAEMNEHDFGWQFGAWEMEGAREIVSVLSEQEKKDYPTPSYPPPMGTNAVFFGGTDPGRFVPTYMIYGAHYRPDVYLITQNALADNTYMNVMRDLYGDLIYIPSQQDSNSAFQQYVADVQSGRVQAGAEVSFENGRVQVQGVGGVMLINGILARMIFEANKKKHDFYVEESYVIPWMYPYLEPHGLIMKLSPEPMQALSPEVVKNDRAFWDWYTKRLIGTHTNLPASVKAPPGAPRGTYELIATDGKAGTNTWLVGMNTKFRVDVVARKTFSKLRSAIAGLYIARRMFPEGEYAFRQAIDLYPLSPEANFRLADAYMQQFRFSDARRIIEDFLIKDRNNTKVGSFLQQIKDMERVNARREELEGILNKGGDISLALELLQIYKNMNLGPRMDGLADSIANQPGVPPQALLQIAQTYSDLKRIDAVARMLQKYLQRVPGDAGQRVSLAKCYVALQQTGAAMTELKQAVQQGGEPVRDIIRRDPGFDPIRGSPSFQALVPPAPTGMPGGPGGLPIF